MGVLFVLFTERFSDNAALRAGILIGVLGGFLPRCRFRIETFSLMEQGARTSRQLGIWRWSLSYFASVVLGWA